VRLLLLALAAAIVLATLRRRRAAPARVVVAWRDGAEAGLAEGSPERERILAAAGRALR
jgi:hypothetical protein